MSAPAASTIRAASAIARRVGAEDLDRERVLVGADPEIAERPLVPVLDPGHRDHLGADEAGAVAAPLAAKCLHADARHRRQNQAAGNLDAAERPVLTKVDVHDPQMVDDPLLRSP